MSEMRAQMGDEDDAHVTIYHTNGQSKEDFFHFLDEQWKGIALDVETVEDIIVGIGIGTDEEAAYFTKGDVVVGIACVARHCLQYGRTLVMHNGKSDVRALRATFPEQCSWPLKDWHEWDTMVAANVLGYEDLDLQTRARDDVHHYWVGKFSELVKEYGAKDLEGVPEHVVAEYNIGQVAATWALYEDYAPRIDSEEWSRKVFELECEIWPILVQMEENGFLIDRERLSKLREQYVMEAEGWIEALKVLSFQQIQNPNSPKQVKEFLYEWLGHKKLGKQYESKKTGDPSTSERVLKKIKAAPEGSLPEYKWITPLLEARQTIKLIGTYCDGIALRLDSEGRSHTTLSQTTADTGRLASRDPNHQNIPKRRGPEIRRCFVAPPGHLLVAADMDQLELRIIAEEAQEQRMRKVFLEGGDIHQKTADEILMDPTKRFPAKILNYTIGYLAGAQQIADQIGCTLSRAQRYQATYFRSYSRLTDWIEEWDTRSRELGYTETWLGRRRDVSAIYKDPKKNYGGGTFKHIPRLSFVGEGTRKAVNTRIQGTAAEIVKISMVKVENELRRLGLASRQLIQVHDEIVLEVPEEEIDVVKWILRKNMSTVYKSMPLPCTVKVGKNWGDVH